MANDETQGTKSEQTARLLQSTRIVVFAQDADLKYLWIENQPSSWRAGGVGKTDIDLLPPAAAAAAASTKREVLTSGHPQWTQLVVPGLGRTRHYDVYVEPTRNAGGAVDGVAGLAIDVTDRRQREESLEAAMRESAHRSRNVLAILQSLATHTALSAKSTDDFIESFRGRMRAVLRSQDLITESSWRGAMLDELVQAQVEPYLADAGNRIEIESVPCRLLPNAALHIGLALSELAINAVRFGALSNPAGKVKIATDYVSDADRTAEGAPVLLVWHEQGGPSGNIKDGFARAILERLVPAAVNGSATLTSTADGTTYEVVISASEFETVPPAS